MSEDIPAQLAWHRRGRLLSIVLTAAICVAAVIAVAFVASSPVPPVPRN